MAASAGSAVDTKHPNGETREHGNRINHPSSLPHPHSEKATTDPGIATQLAGPSDPTFEDVQDTPPIVAISSVRKWSLLAVYSFAMFIDIWSFSAFFIFTNQISLDLGIEFTQQSWIITSYQITFTSVLLFWGRFVDLFSPRLVFIYGFLTLGFLNLIISFLPDKFSFFIFRALSGLFGSALIPASYRLITSSFHGKQLQTALVLYGVSGAVATVTGQLVAGVIDLIPGQGQMIAWRWFFRVAAALVIPIGLVSLVIVPHVESKSSLGMHWKEKMKQLDLIGCVIILIAMTLLIISLTFGASYGWSKPSFIVPLILSIINFPTFFWWESRLTEQMALLPSSTWKIPNLVCLATLGLYIYGFFSANFLVFADYYMLGHHESGIKTAARLVPEGVASIAICLFLTFFPRYVSQPRYPVILGISLGLLSLLLWIFSSDQAGVGYWKFIFPGMVLGTFGLDTTFTAVNVGVIVAAPKEKTGVSSAVLQVAFQIGSIVALAIQAATLTVRPGGISDWFNVQVSFWLEFAWGLVSLIVFLVWYKPIKVGKNDGERQSV